VDLPAWQIPTSVAADAKDLLRYQLVAVARDRFGVPIDATYVQTPGVIDALYGAAAAAVPLGVTWNGGTPTIRVWAPTADVKPGVTLTLYSDASARRRTSRHDARSRHGRLVGDRQRHAWNRRYYDFTLRVWSYASRGLCDQSRHRSLVVSLSADSRFSQVVNLSDADTQAGRLG
jgi:pullulanase